MIDLINWLYDRSFVLSKCVLLSHFLLILQVSDIAVTTATQPISDGATCDWYIHRNSIYIVIMIWRWYEFYLVHI